MYVLWEMEVNVQEENEEFLNALRQMNGEWIAKLEV